MIANFEEQNIYLDDQGFTLLYGDSFKLLKRIKEESVDMIFADPPYFCQVVEYLVKTENRFLLTKVNGITPKQ